VVDADDAFDALDQAHEDGDERRAIHGSGQGDDAVGHLDADRPALEPEAIVEDLVLDLTADVPVGTEERLQQVATRHDADHPAVAVDHRQRAEPPPVHEPRGVGEGRIGPDRHGG
jgi:hypothetical protein